MNEPLIDWVEIQTKYPAVFRDMALRILNLNRITKDWFETRGGKRVSLPKVHAKLAKDMQETAYDILRVYFEVHNLMASITPYKKGETYWLQFEVFDLKQVVKDNSSVYVEEGFETMTEARTAAVKKMIDLVALKMQ